MQIRNSKVERKSSTQKKKKVERKSEHLWQGQGQEVKHDVLKCPWEASRILAAQRRKIFKVKYELREHKFRANKRDNFMMVNLVNIKY